MFQQKICVSHILNTITPTKIKSTANALLESIFFSEAQAWIKLELERILAKYLRKTNLVGYP